MFPGFQKAPVFLLMSDGDILPEYRPGVQQLRDHMTDLDEKIMIFHGLAVTAEKMLQIETMILLRIETLILNGPSSSAINQ